MNSSLKKRINRLTKRNNRLSKRSNRLSKRSNRLSKRSNRLSKRSNRLTKRNNRLTKRNNRLTKRSKLRELYGGAVKPLIKTNDRTTYYGMELNGRVYIFITKPEIKGLIDNLNDLYKSFSCKFESKHDWGNLYNAINASYNSAIESYLKGLETRIEELGKNHDIGRKCKEGFLNAFGIFKDSGKYIHASIQQGKILRYTHDRKEYLFDPLDIQISVTESTEPIVGNNVIICDPHNNVSIAEGVVKRVSGRGSWNPLNGDCTVEWKYKTPPQGIDPNKSFTTNFLYSALKMPDYFTPRLLG